MDWQPIETAPKDGTRILLGGCVNGPSIEIGDWGSHGRYDRRTKAFEQTWGNGPNRIYGPTHWMPLPAPPATLQSSGE